MKSSFAKNIRSSTLLPGIEAHAVTTTLKDIVSLELSFFLPTRSLSVQDIKIASLTAQLLDAGTKRHSKEILRKMLEERGASVSFSTDQKWLSAHVQCLREDVPFVLTLISEMLEVPSLKQTEADILKKRAYADLENAKSQTGVRATRGLRKAMFSTNHVHWTPSIEDEQKCIQKLKASDAVRFHGEVYGRSQGYIVAVGDVDVDELTEASAKAFKKLKAKSHTFFPTLNEKKPQEYREIISIADQASVDLRLGHALSITRSDARYYPLLILMDMLGGGFSAHLMQTVRERDGLTYGIYAGLGGFTDGTDGWWQIGGTFAPQIFKKGEEVVRHELDEFLSHGVTEESVKGKKEEILGTYKISLATSRGLASTILFGLEEGLGTDHVDTHVDKIERVSLNDVIKARELIDTKKMALVAAGSIDSKGDPL
jgi:zinc protease